MLIDIKMKMIGTELGHSDHLKIYINPSKIYINRGIQIHANDLFSETTAPNKAAGLQKNKIQAAQESSMTAVAKNS